MKHNYRYLFIVATAIMIISVWGSIGYLALVMGILEVGQMVDSVGATLSQTLKSSKSGFGRVDLENAERVLAASHGAVLSIIRCYNILEFDLLS